MDVLGFIAYFVITCTLLSSKRKWVSALGLILEIPFLLFILVGLVMYLWENLFVIAISLLTAFVGGYIHFRRKYNVYRSSISVRTTIKVPLKEYRNMQYFLLKGKAVQREDVRNGRFFERI